jgi:hypothetical protein
MHRTTGLSQVTRALADGTGRSQETIGLLVAAAASATAVLGLVRVVDVAMDLGLRSIHRS